MTRGLRLVPAFGILAILVGACWETAVNWPATQTFAREAQPTTASADDVTVGCCVRGVGIRTTRRASVAQPASYLHGAAICRLAALPLTAVSTTEARSSIPLYELLRVYRL